MSFAGFTVPRIRLPKAVRIAFVVIAMLGGIMSYAVVSAPAPQAAAAGCTANSFFGLDPWYKYLDQKEEQNQYTGRTECRVSLKETDGGVNAVSIWLIALVIVDDLLRIGGLLAVGYILYGAFQYLTSQGEADKAKSGRQTIINALVGLGISTVAVVMVNFIGATLSKK